MASIMKRGNTYSVRYNYKDHAGKPCKGWETFKTKAEAQERKITVEKELLDGTFLVPDTMTVEEMLYKWIPIQSSKHKWSPDPLRPVRSRRKAGADGKSEEAAVIQHVHSRSPHAPEDRLFVCR